EEPEGKFLRRREVSSGFVRDIGEAEHDGGLCPAPARVDVPPRRVRGTTVESRPGAFEALEETFAIAPQGESDQPVRLGEPRVCRYRLGLLRFVEVLLRFFDPAAQLHH